MFLTPEEEEFAEADRMLHQNRLQILSDAGSSPWGEATPRRGAESGGVPKTADDKGQKCNAEGEYNQLLKKKRSYASNECVSVAMLCQIPGISTTIANVLVAQFGTVGMLAARLNEQPGLLDEWRYAETTTKSGDKGKGKRMSKPMVAAIKDALLPLLAPK